MSQWAELVLYHVAQDADMSNCPCHKEDRKKAASWALETIEKQKQELKKAKEEIQSLTLNREFLQTQITRDQFDHARIVEAYEEQINELHECMKDYEKKLGLVEEKTENGVESKFGRVEEVVIKGSMGMSVTIEKPEVTTNTLDNNTFVIYCKKHRSVNFKIGR